MSPAASADDLMRVDRLLNQDEVWTAERGTIRIDDMDIDHVQRLIPWLERRAKGLADGYFLAFVLSTPLGEIGDGAWGSLEREMQAAQTDPVAWLHTTKLMRRLDERVADALADAEEALS